MITNLKVQHFRSIESLDLDLAPINVFVGQNGAGKSNIIDSLRFCRDAVTNGLDQAITDRHGMTNIRQWSPTRPYDLSVEVAVESNEEIRKLAGNFGFTISSTKNQYSVKREVLNFDYQFGMLVREPGERRPTTRRKKFSYVRDGLDVDYQEDDEEPEQTKMSNAEELFINHHPAYFYSPLKVALSGFQTYSIFPNTLRSPQKQSSEQELSSHGDNVASIIKQMRSEKRSSSLNEIVQGMQAVLPDLENVTVQALGGFIVPRFAVKPDDGKGHFFDVDQVSDGTLRILGILVALYQEPGPEIIALEEPELTVHPGVLSMLADAIKDVARSRQILITTHSPELLDHFHPDNIIAVEMEGGVTQVRPINRAQKKAVQENLMRLGELMTVEGIHG